MTNLLDDLLLLLYTACLYTLWQLCRWGGIRSHLKRLLPLLALLLLLTFLKCLLRYKGFRSTYFRARALTFAGISVLFGGLIVYTAMPYNGQLSWKIDDLLHHKKIEYTHTNLYMDGVEGMLTDIEEKLALPAKLYILNRFSADFTADGTIMSVDTMLYGENEKGEIQTYLLSYNAKQGTKLDVWTGGEANASCDSALLWSPLPDILSKADIEASVQSWSVDHEDALYEILYYGKRSFQTDEGLRFIEGDADGDGISGTADAIYKVQAGGEVSGYEVSLYMPNDSEITPLRYIMEPEYIPQSMLDAQHEDEMIASAQNATGWTVDQEDGSVYTFAQSDANVGYRLVVTDAAAGSRFYSLEKSTDAGKQWSSINEDPFDGNLGVAEGIEFFNESLGFIGLQGASGSHSRILITEDGGQNFSEIKLPMNQITEVPEPGKSYGMTLDDYQYLTMPVYDGSTLQITVTTGSDEKAGIAFASADQGATWTLLDQGTETQK